MNMLKLQNRIWPVAAVVALAAASTAIVSAADAQDLDPQVWQAIVAGADYDSPDLAQPLTGEMP